MCYPNSKRTLKYPPILELGIITKGINENYLFFYFLATPSRGFIKVMEVLTNKASKIERY